MPGRSSRCVRGSRPTWRGQLVKTVKQTKMKVQVAIQGDKLRVTGKKRDDLQQVIALLKETKVDLPLQHINFRD